MWQAETFAAVTIRRELRYANRIGMNVMCVYLHNLVWQYNAEAFVQRIKTYLNIAAESKIKTLFVLFDDCWHPSPQLGPQPMLVPNSHNSGWVQSPGTYLVNDEGSWPPLLAYLENILHVFGQDDRIIAWDL
jgi:hypothetical protein